ncbi:MAG: FtsX-like permease family protein [Phycisphaerae bacterium]
MYKLFLTLRYLRKGRIAYFAIGAVTLCVAMVLIVLSVMGGWLEMVKKQARGLLGDIIVDNQRYAGFPLYDEFIAEISEWPEIAKATPVIYSWSLFNFRTTEQTATARVVGIRLSDVYDVNAFKSSLFYEKYYPGTTNLGEQGQPLIGFDLNSKPIPVHDEDGTLVGELHRPILPSPYREALETVRERHAEQARARGEDEALSDPDSVPSPFDAELARYHLPLIPGVYAINDRDGMPGIAGDPWPGIIFGRDIVAERQSDGRYDRYYPRGTLVTVTLWATSARGNVDPIPVKQPFRYVDDSRTGIYAIDSEHIYCDFTLLQKLLQMNATPRVDADGNIVGTSPARCSQIQIKVADGVNAAALTERLQSLYRSYVDDSRFELDLTERILVSHVKAMTWQQSQASIIAPVEKEKVLVTILFGIISLVAVALILCILYMIVLQKTRDIGIIKAIGGSSAGVAFVFVIYGAAVGVVGGLLGTVLGSLVVTYINEIQDFLTSLNPAWRVWDLKVYSFDKIPSEVSPWDVAFVALAALAASTLGSFAAAWRAGSMQPVEAIRHE